MGEATKDRFHIQKGEDALRGLKKLVGNPALDLRDRAVAQGFINRLQNALNGK